jgi:two-component system, chemotaxis family, protein-glutamate methylesterase/glutaminase
MTNEPIKVVIVDDSAFARKVLRETLNEAHGFRVVGYARDGLEALELVSLHQPEVVTLDLMMPNLDGLGFLRSLGTQQRAPEVVVVSSSGADTALGIEALELGAFAIVQKPSAMATPRLYDLADEIRATLLAAANSRRSVQQRIVEVRPPPAPPTVLEPLPTKRSVMLIGTSTGGPPALTRLLSSLPANFPVPIAVALHIPAGYTQSLAERLNEISALHVVEAHDGLVLEPGMVAIAPGGDHLVLRRRDDRLVAHLTPYPEDMLHKPSVDLLFSSAVGEGKRALAVVLTGMGDDGLQGAIKLHQAGATILTEAESSCVVYGMPRAISEANVTHASADLDRMADLILLHTVEGKPNERLHQ